jgi:hypothetical protein
MRTKALVHIKGPLSRMSVHIIQFKGQSFKCRLIIGLIYSLDRSHFILSSQYLISSFFSVGSYFNQSFWYSTISPILSLSFNYFHYFNLILKVKKIKHVNLIPILAQFSLYEWKWLYPKWFIGNLSAPSTK